MKKLIILVSILISINAYSQDTTNIIDLQIQADTLFVCCVKYSAFEEVVDTTFFVGYDTLYVEDIFNAYESQLGYIKQPITLDSYPDPIYGYKIIPKEPNYKDFKKWLNNWINE